MELSRVENDIITVVLESPGTVIFDLLHRVKPFQHTYTDIRHGILNLLMKRVLLIDDQSGQRIYFNRNQRLVYRGIV